MADRKLLIIDDDADMRDVLRLYLEDRSLDVAEAGLGQEGLKLLRSKGPFDLVFLDLRLPDLDGLEVLELIQAGGYDVPVVMMTAYSSSTQAIRAMQLGAYDYVIKPFELEEVGLLIDRLFEHRQLAEEVRLLQDQLSTRDARDRIIGLSEPMQEVYKVVGRVAGSSATVLIIGETGTGKELVADIIQQNSPRRRGPFIKVNCAALPETLLESELFGHEKGSFTSAVAQRKGVFELASSGTIFLDEIGEMSLSTQKKLLRVLQEGEFQRVGGSTPIKVDVRVIAATNKDLYQEVEKRNFREDLYYRLNVIRIDLPPLRTRHDDIPLLVAHFLDKYRYAPDMPPIKISEDALQTLLQHDWPGNVRELENTIQRAVVLSQGRMITREDLPMGAPPTRTPALPARVLDFTDALRRGVTLQQAVADVEQGMVRAALDMAGGDTAEAARILGTDSANVQTKIDAYNLANTRQKEGA